MLQLWLFLHILGAIAAFGFGFYAPIFGMASAKEPQHGNWFLRASKRLSNVIIIPFAILMFITGALLVRTGTAEWSDPWLRSRQGLRGRRPRFRDWSSACSCTASSCWS